MRTPSLVLAAVAMLALGGCAVSPRPARTEVTPGESEFRSEREDRRPSESRLRIRATTPAPEAPPEPPVRIRITVPRQPVPEPDGGAR